MWIKRRKSSNIIEDGKEINKLSLNIIENEVHEKNIENLVNEIKETENKIKKEINEKNYIKKTTPRISMLKIKLTPINIKNNYYVLIVKPDAGCSTKDIFELADSMNLKTCDVDGVIRALEEGDDDYLAENIGNSLQDPAISLVPVIQTIIDELKENGLKIVQVTGSGSAVFAVSTDRNLLKKMLKKLENKYEVELAKVIK